MDKQSPLSPLGNERLVMKRDPETSRLAAEELRGSPRLGGLQGLLFDAVKQWPGLIIREMIVEKMHMDVPTVSPRYAELRRMGLIRQGPKRRSTITGKLCLTWWPVQEGERCE